MVILPSPGTNLLLQLLSFFYLFHNIVPVPIPFPPLSFLISPAFLAAVLHAYGQDLRIHEAFSASFFPVNSWAACL